MSFTGGWSLFSEEDEHYLLSLTGGRNMERRTSLHWARSWGEQPGGRWFTIKNLKKGEKINTIFLFYEKVTDFCPGVPGYCSLDYPGGLCTFECLTVIFALSIKSQILFLPRERMHLLPQVVIGLFQGPHIRSSCAPDGTWQPYPTCEVKNYFGSLYPIFW